MLQSLKNTEEQEKHWFAIRTKPHQEQIAQTNLDQQGLIAYLPLVQKIIKHARKKERVARPLFPGYLFVHLSESEQQWETISSTRGTVGPVRFGDSIPIVPDWVIDSFQSLENEQHLLDPKKILEKRLVPGSKVSLELNGHKEIQGIFHCFKGKDRAVILLDLLNRQVKTITHCSNILT